MLKPIDRLADLACEHPVIWREVMASYKSFRVSFQVSRIGLELRKGYTIRFNGAYVLSLAILDDERLAVTGSTLVYFQQHAIIYPDIKIARVRLRRDILLLALIDNLIERRGSSDW